MVREPVDTGGGVAEHVHQGEHLWTLNSTAANERFQDHLQTIEPLRMSTGNTTVVDKEINGRWAG